MKCLTHTHDVEPLKEYCILDIRRLLNTLDETVEVAYAHQLSCLPHSRRNSKKEVDR